MKIRRYLGPPSDELIELLLTADPDEAAVRSYLVSADVLIAQLNNDLAGVAVLSLQDGIPELRNLAVAHSFQGKGVAKQLIAESKQWAASRGAVALDVATGNSSLNQLALYQKCGFRIHSVERDYFANYPEPIFENGIRCVDRIRLRVEIQPDSNKSVQ